MAPCMAIMNLAMSFGGFVLRFRTLMASFQKHVAITFSLLQKKIRPTFFDVMVHLLLHVIDELDVSNGEDDEGSKVSCSFHGTTLRF